MVTSSEPTDTAETALGGRKRDAERSLFRKEAVDAYLQRDLDGALLPVLPRAFRLASLGGCTAVIALLLIAAFSRVEVTTRGPCVLVAAGGISRPVVVQTGGPVAELAAQTGDSVQAGSPLLRIDSSPIKAQVLEAERAVNLAKSTLSRIDGDGARSVATRVALNEQRIALLRRKTASLATTTARLQRQVASYESLFASGNGSRAERDAAEEKLAQALRERIGVEEQLTAILDQNAAIKADHERERWRAQEAVEAADARLASLQLNLEQATVRAPVSGTVEALSARPGEVLSAGATIARLVPDGAASTIVAFIPERDRAFLEVGAEARVELDQLTPGEFPRLRARVLKIAKDEASPREIREVLGEAATLPDPVYRVELEIERAAGARDPLASMVRNGMLGNVRVVLRRRRLVSLFVAPIRGWLEP